MTIADCDGCGRDVITSNPDTDSFCPDCAGGSGHSAEYQQRQARSADADRHRQRVIDNAVNQGGSL